MSQQPHRQFSVRELVLGAIISCVALGMASWKGEPELPLAKQKAIYRALCQYRDPFGATPDVATEYNVSVETVKRIFHQGSSEGWDER